MDRPDSPDSPDVCRSQQRRRFLLRATTGTVIAAMGGGLYTLADGFSSEAKAGTRSDGRARVPPGQRVITALKPMGGQPGNPRRSDFRLRIHGEVENPFELDFREMLSMDVVEQPLDVHCVTGWSCLGARFKGVRIKDLAARAGLKSQARHVIFEAANGYTANVRLRDGIADTAMLTWELDGRPLRRPHGAPVRAVVPDLYFWKSPKWLTGIRFVKRDKPGYWETRGYHNHADPWREQRYG